MRTEYNIHQQSVQAWLGAALGSVAVCLLVLVTGPRLVPKLLRPYATLTFKDKKDKGSSGCRYVAFVHSVTVALLNYYMLVCTDVFDDSRNSKVSGPLMQRQSRLTNISLGISLGYFLVDALFVAWYLPAMGGTEMVIHHIAAFVSVLVTLLCEEAHMYTLVLLSTEATTPFINFRWLLEKMGWKDSKLYKANGLALLISWMLIRIVMFAWMFDHLFHRRDQIPGMHWQTAGCLLTVPVLLSILNLLWFTKIVRGAYKVFCSSSTAKKGGKKKQGTQTHLANGHIHKME